MNRSLLIAALLLSAVTPLSAQDGVVLNDKAQTEVVLESVNSDLRSFLTLHTPDGLKLFTGRPISAWLEDQARLSDASVKASQRSMFRRLFAGSFDANPDATTPDVRYTPLTAVAAARRDTVGYLPLPVKRDTATKDVLPGVLAQYADLGIAVTGNGQLGGTWSKYSPCDVVIKLQCNAGVFPQLRPDMTFGVKIAGTVNDRVHVNVNFDQKNEFDAANNLNVSYEGLANEVLQRVDVGDVSIRLPTSRYMTRGIPAGNFGLRATGQLGPLDFQTVFAQQKGDLARRKFTVSGGGAQQTVVQQQHLVVDDAEYVQGQFFYLIDPTQIAGTPYFDPLALRAQDAPPSVRPGTSSAIALYRDERVSTTSGVGNAELGRFLADALPARGGLRHSGTFRRLTPDVDYVVHSSGLWITLKSPLRSEEALAMAYVTESGDTIGNIKAEQSPPGTTPVLRLLRGPASVHQPGAPTWLYEMHNIYRIDTSEGVDLSSVEMKISLGDLAGGKTFQNVAGTQVTFLKFFGLDEDAPSDRIDEAQIFQPSRGVFGDATGAIPGTFVVFPALQPFVDPAPVPSQSLTAADLKAALSTNANTAIYNDVDPVNRAAAGRFKVTFDYRVKAGSAVSSFNLGAFGIRDESERIMLGAQQLQRGVDYEIDYDIGQLTLRDASTLFATHPGAELSATWEQKPMFQVAPTSVFGMNARYSMGQRGQFDVVGLFQSEKSLMARPQLGTEPGSIFLGGVSGTVNLGGALLDRVFNNLPGLRLGGPSSARLTAEMALSSPNPNTKGDAYVEDFEATDELRVDPRRQNWQLGSRTESTTGDEGTLPTALNVLNAAPLVWSHDFKNADGQLGGAFKPSQFVDQNIKFVGNEPSDYGLYLSFGNATAPSPDVRSWRSITTVLSSTGSDMTRSEYLEFYAAIKSGPVEPLALIFDIGTVGEDGFYVDSAGRTTGEYPDGDRTRWGLGILDEEARLANREVWGTGANSPDSRGLWNQACTTAPGEVYALGDPRTNCTRSNGIRNTEDLDGNGVLSANDGAYFRYVVTLDKLSQYIVRTTAETRTGYQLYRVPLRAGVPINGANDGTWRFIKQMRMTVAGNPTGGRTIALARMRIIGSRWTKRDPSGVNRGVLSDVTGTGGADVRVDPISRLVDPVYVSPGAVNTNVQDKTTTIGATGVENNEKSLRIAYDNLAADNRAEVYYRYAQQARSFMNYRELHMWALPRRGVWGVPNGERLIVKIGTDARNFYLFQTKLHPAPATVSGQSWLPEVVINFDEWFALKDQAERNIIEHPPAAGAQDTVWSADSTYAIVLEDRARAPNLSQVREISFAVYNGGSMATDGEVWIDDMRLTGAQRAVGRAGAVALDMNIGDFINGSMSFAQQGDVFQQLNENATYIASGDFSFNADAHLDRLLPARLGIDLPVSITHTAQGQDPTFLESTDVLAKGLGSLRETGSGTTRVGVRLSKRTPTANPWLSLLIDGTALRFGYSTAGTRAITSRFETGSMDAGLSYSHPVASKSFDIIPGFIENAFRALVPKKVETSDAFGRLIRTRLRYTPDGISFNTGYNNQMARTYNYDRILALDIDSLVRAIESPRQGLQNDVRVSLSPFSGLTTSIGATSDRDLLAAERATQDPQARAALQGARSRFGGIDMGWETNRALRTDVRYAPNVASWIVPTYTYSNTYTTDRNASYLNLSSANGIDTTSELQRRFESGRTTATGIEFRPADFAIAAFGPKPKRPQGMSKWSRGAIGAFERVELTWRNNLNSQFERESILPGFGYQLGLGDLGAFRVIGTDTAARALQTDEFRTTAGFAPSKHLRTDLSYGLTDLHSLDLRGGERLQHERSWPRISASIRDLAMPDKWQKYLVSANIGGGIDRIRTTNVFGGNSAQDRSTARIERTLTSTLTFPHAISLTYSGKATSGKNADPTGRRETLNGLQSLGLRSILPPPIFLSSRMTQPVALSLTFTQVSTTQCGASTLLVSSLCTTQVRTTSRQGHLEASTGLDQMRLGLSLDYNGRQNHVGTQTGQSQFELRLFGNFALNAGTMPTEFGGIR